MTTQEEIEYNFSLKCNYSHVTCKGIKEKLDRFHREGYQVNNSFLTRYLLFLQGGYGYNSYYSCTNQPNNWLPPLKTIFSYLNPTEEDMIIMVGMKYITNDIFKMFIDRGIYIPPDILTTSIQAKNNNLTNYLIKHVPVSPEILEQICEHQPDCMDAIKYILEQKIDPTTKSLNALLKNKHTNTVDMMFKLGAAFDESSLAVACATRNFQYITKILDLKIVPDKTCYNAIFDNVRKNYYGNRQSYNADEVANIVDILVVHGYKPDYEDVVTALKHGCYIRDVKRFGIKFDSEFLERCTEEEYYPYPDLDAKPTLKCLRIECGRANNLKSIKQLLSYGLEPDIECLRNACKHKTNKTVINYLVTHHKLKPDLQCLKNNADYIRNATLTYLLENINFDDPKDDLKDDPKDDLKDDQHIESEEAKDSPVEKPENSLEDDPILITIVEEDDPTEKPKSKPKVKAKAKAKRTKKPNVEIIDDLDEVEQKVAPKNDLTIPKNVPTNKRIKNKIDENILELFSQKKGTKLSFLDLRKLMLGYITNNNLIDKDDKTLVKPDANLCKILKIDKGKTVEFSNIDSLVSQCYK
jgi:hypothetical protein